MWFKFQLERVQENAARQLNAVKLLESAYQYPYYPPYVSEFIHIQRFSVWNDLEIFNKDLIWC
jgi:hypothetical protein